MRNTLAMVDRPGSRDDPGTPERVRGILITGNSSEYYHPLEWGRFTGFKRAVNREERVNRDFSVRGPVSKRE